MKRIATVVLLVFLAGAQRAAAQCGTTTAESFTGGTNQAHWNWGTAGDVILTSGGSPGAYLRKNALDTISPQPRTGDGVASVFADDYQARGVTSLGIDLQTFFVNFSTTCQRPLSLVLDSDMGTPSTSDDVYIYFVSSDQVPCVDGRWHSFTVSVPSQTSTMPTGWNKDPFTSLTPDQAWNVVIHDVDRVRWYYGDLTTFYPLALWNVGMDNPRISFGKAQTTYCTAKVNSLGCSPAIGYSGLPSVTLPTSFVIQASQVRNNKAGLLFYGVNGKASSLFQGGTLCIKTPIRRTPSVVSGGTPLPADDCTGVFSMDFNAFAQSGQGDPALQITGTVVDVQWWGRDPGFAPPNGTTLSNALDFVMCP